MNRLDRLTPLLQSFVEKGPAGCACRVAQRGETLYEQYVGYADLETKKPINQDTIYRQYSTSKIATCTAALMLYEKGLYALNDPLEEYLPEFKNPQVYRYTARGAQYTSAAARSIRIRDLFMMASGYPYPDNTVETARQMAKAFEEVEKNTEPRSPFTLRDFTKKLAAIPLAFDPGTHWMYGMSHDILGAFIEVVSGKTFGQFLKDEMFDPLGMADTSFRIAVNKRERLCSLYNRTEDGVLTKNTDMDADYQPGAVFESGGGGLLSTLSDYSRLAQVLACGELDGVRLLNPNTIRLMSTNHLSAQQLADYDWPMLTGFGYGLGVRTLIDPAAGGCNSNLGEFGWGGMAGTIVIIDPKEQLSIAYMQQLIPNREDYHTPRLRNVVYGAM